MDGDLIRQTFSPKKALLLRQLQDSSLAKLPELVVNIWTSLWSNSLKISKKYYGFYKPIYLSSRVLKFYV